MEVVAAQREKDSRLTLLVQGVGRGIVLRATRDVPYTRADFQLFPDDEQLLAAARRASAFVAKARLRAPFVVVS